MTKLLEWLCGVGVFTAVWGALISRHIQAQLLEEWMSVIIPLPLILVTLFGVSIMMCYKVEDRGIIKTECMKHRSNIMVKVCCIFIA